MPRTIRQTWDIPAKREEVYAALTDSKMLAKWFLKSAEFPKRAGEKYHFKWIGGHESTAKVLKLEKDKLVSLEWPQHDSDGRFLGNTVVTFAVERSNGGSLVRLEHVGYGDSNNWVENYALTHSGWAYYFMNMKSIFGTGHDLRAPRDETSTY